MNIVTTISREWRNRMLIQAAFMVGFGLWFFYDGSVSYPKHNDRLAEYKAAVARGETAKWSDFAAKKGWPGQDHPAPYSSAELKTQFVLGAICVAMSGATIIRFLIGRRQKMSSDGQTICGVRGERVPLEAFVSVDKRKWERKSIAYAFYEQDGQRRRLTIDDYKFIGAEDILKQIEEQIAKKECALMATGNSFTQPRNPPAQPRKAFTLRRKGFAPATAPSTRRTTRAGG
ncbi:MAG: hypothetical protein HZC54_04045 [Verrucomicrobia bacterium]|nr:hypothetical protein [Verrucomicrobiota bacterium]